MPGAGLFTMFMLTVVYTYFPGIIGPLFDAMGADMDMNTAIELRERLALYQKRLRFQRRSYCR